MRLLAIRKSEQNHAGVDPWTAVHVSAGLAFGLMNVPLRWALAAAVAYELVEHVAESRQWGQRLFVTSGPEVVLNYVLDTVVFAVGHELGRRWNDT